MGVLTLPPVRKGILIKFSTAVKKDTKDNGSRKPLAKSFLDPINAEKDEDSPIPLKATLARSATRRNTRKVPPITSSSNKYIGKDDDTDSAYAASLGSTLEAESHFEMMNSLMSIRSSATKKKEKIIEKQSSTSSLLSRSPSPDSTLRESGFWSTYSSNKDTDRESDASIKSKKSSKKVESPFESRPKLARTGSLHNSTKKEIDGETIYVDYNPQSGVTFRENKNSDVQIVGKGYNEDGGSGGSLTDSRSQCSVASTISNKSKDLQQRKPSKVTKGMFENVNGTEHAINTGNSQSNDRQDRKPMKQDRKDIPSGVVGVSVNKQGSLDDPSMDILDDVDDDPNNLRMSQGLSDKIAQMQKQKEEEAEIKREKKKQDHEEKLKKERERQQEKLRRLNTSESLALSISGAGSGSGSGTNSGYNTPKTRSSPSLTPRKKSRPQIDPESSHPSSASSRTPIDSDSPEDWKPYKDPELAMKQAQKTIAHEDWEMKCNGINGIRKMNMFHKEILLANLHPTIVALLTEVKNLRSQVSRGAIVCLGEMFTNLTRYMDTDLDSVVRGLLAKNGETNMFIREDSERSLAAMVDNINPQRALLALISGGATHKNANVRKTTSIFLVMLVQKMGPGRILSGVKDITDRILPAVAQFAIDGSQETRYNGKKILYQLMSHQDFDKMLQKHLPANTLRNVKEIVESLRIKGLGDGPSETSSARGWRSGHGSRSSSVLRGSSAGSDNHHATPKRRNTRTDESTMEEIKDVINMMSANDWRDRYKGINTLLEMCEMNSNLVASNVVKIFDKFLPRLQDPNSKVNLYALQVMLQIIPILNDSLGTVISMAVGNVSPNLSSKNKEIYSTAMSIIEAFMDNIDATQLIQPMANQAQSASARSKPHLVMKVADLVNRVYPKKQKQVILHVLPLLWHLLGATNSSGAIQGGSSTIRTATGKLVNALHSHLGHSLIDRASSDPNVTPRHIQLLHDLIDH